MAFLLWGLLAAGIAWVINYLASKFLGEQAVLFVSPLIEELLKTGAAWLGGAPIVLTHATFGSVEAVYDLSQPTGGVSGGITSFLGHLAFGSITELIYHETGSIWLGWLLATAAHMLWNRTVSAIITGK